MSRLTPPTREDLLRLLHDLTPLADLPETLDSASPLDARWDWEGFLADVYYHIEHRGVNEKGSMFVFPSKNVKIGSVQILTTSFLEDLNMLKILQRITYTRFAVHNNWDEEWYDIFTWGKTPNTIIGPWHIRIVCGVPELEMLAVQLEEENSDKENTEKRWSEGKA